MEWTKIKRFNPVGPDYPEATKEYVLREEAEAKIDRQKRLNVATMGLARNYRETIQGNEIDIAGLQERIRELDAERGSANELHVRITELKKQVRELEAEVARLRRERQHLRNVIGIGIEKLETAEAKLAEARGE